jgi:hypothetical protein
MQRCVSLDDAGDRLWLIRDEVMYAAGNQPSFHMSASAGMETFGNHWEQSRKG